MGKAGSKPLVGEGGLAQPMEGKPSRFSFVSLQVYRSGLKQRMRLRTSQKPWNCILTG